MIRRLSFTSFGFGKILSNGQLIGENFQNNIINLTTNLVLGLNLNKNKRLDFYFWSPDFFSGYAETHSTFLKIEKLSSFLSHYDTREPRTLNWHRVGKIMQVFLLFKSSSNVTRRLYFLESCFFLQNFAFYMINK